MHSLLDLESALARLNVEALARFDSQSAAPMAKLAEDLSRRRSLKATAASLPSFVERQVAALRRFRRRDQEPDFRTLRLVCLACALYVAEDRFVLLADAAELEALLAAVERYANEPRRLRRLFDVLLRAYLGVDRAANWFADAAGGQGNEQLRRFLVAHFVNVRKTEPAPEWVRTLAACPEILSDDPGRRFAHGLLAGDSRDLEEAFRGLGITGASWLAIETVRTATGSATAEEDSKFVSRIPALLGVATEPRFAPLRDEVYAALVTRYADIAARPIHAQLRDALIAAWKNPWLERNDSAWGRVSPHAREMVAGWLKLDLMRQFFDVLSDDRGQDRSRFQFWSQHHERIDDAYIALGRNAYHSGRPDLVKLRHALDGRLLELTSAGSDTHAFIMFMGDDVVVEFSQKGNAAFRYRRGDAPIRGALRTVPIWQLKSSPPGVRLIHGHARGLTWQQRFSLDLNLAASMQPASWHRPWPGAAKDRGTQLAPTRQRQSLSHVPAPSVDTSIPDSQRRASSSLGNIGAFARTHGLPWVDHRSKGGNVWVFARDDGSEIARQLKAWGFAYREGRGWWRA